MKGGGVGPWWDPNGRAWEIDERDVVGCFIQRG